MEAYGIECATEGNLGYSDDVSEDARRRVSRSDIRVFLSSEK